MIFCARVCGRKCFRFYNQFCAQMIVMISRVTASGSGMCGVLAFDYFVINFAPVTTGVDVFLRSFYQL